MKTRAASGSGAPFLIVVTLLIVFYIIFLPPADREALLNGSPTSQPGGTGSTPSTTKGLTNSSQLFVFTGPGDMVRASQSEFLHDISPITLQGLSQATVLASAGSLLIRSSIFDKSEKEVTFSLESPQSIKDPMLAMNAKGAPLTIYLNGQEIYSADESQGQPFKLDATLLQPKNVLTFSTPAPDFAFWQKNTVQITDLKLIATVLDQTSLAGEQLFYVRTNEIQNYKSSRLRFVPDCSADVEPLRITINSVDIYNQVPDCGEINIVTLAKGILASGENTISFSSTQGRYLLDRIQVQTYLDTNRGVTYYFSLDPKLFVYGDKYEPACGEIDSYCPQGCSADVDKDCCFREYDTAFWCDVPTQLVSDRCVGRVDTFNANRCASGYKDDSRNVAEAFRNTCGDDDDNVCPQGCSSYYDKDCCLVDNTDTYWCDDVPQGGVINKCKAELSVDEYAFCPAGYDSERSGKITRPQSQSDSLEYRNIQLKSDLRVQAEFIFVDDGVRKQTDVNINGYKMSVDTTRGSYVADITRFVTDNNNYINIVPQTDLSLVQVRVQVQKI